MTKYITRTEYNEMVNTIVDEVTGMTALDQWELTHPLDDLVVLEEEDDEDEYLDYEDYDLEMGFDPYEGCYTYDC
jgi:hypothetical protein